MIKALLIDVERSIPTTLVNTIQDFCPEISLSAKPERLANVPQLLEDERPSLVFFNISEPCVNFFKLLYHITLKDLDCVILSDQRELAFDVIKFSATGFVLKPVQPLDLMQAVSRAIKNIEGRQAWERDKKMLSQHVKKIGIPTMEGFDFVLISNIVRCEAMQRCTLIYTKDGRKIISSYNLGEFIKLLETFGFFSTHKSHLINLSQIQKYSREGSVLMSDGFSIPVSRRRRNHFLKAIDHV